jgi:RNA polymerase sigma factor (sigma-70 family)
MNDDTNYQIEQLIEACISGDRQSQGRLYNLFSQRMFTVCLRYATSREEAEDILQEGFITVFECMNQYRHKGSFEGWIRKIILNCALQRYRNKKKLRPVVDINATIINQHAANDEIISAIGAKELLVMVQQLPPTYRMVFNLYVFEGMKHREIAMLLGISEGTSKSNLSDARVLLQKAVHKSLQSPLVKYSRNG